MKTTTRTIEVQETRWPEEMPRGEFLILARSLPWVAYARLYATRHILLETTSGAEWIIYPGEKFCYSYDIEAAWLE